MNALLLAQPFRKWHIRVTKSVFMLNIVNFSSIPSQHASKTRGLYLRYLVPLRMKTRSAVTNRTSGMQDKLRVKDGVPPEYELIYRAPMNNYITVTQGLSLLFSSIIIVGSVYKYVIKGDFSEKSETGNQNQALVIQTNEQFIFFSVMFLIACFSLQVFAFKYPVRIYTNGADSYIAAYIAPIPAKSRLMEFKAENVTKLPPSGIMPWRSSWIKINERKNIILKHYFRKPMDFHAMVQEE